MTRICIVTATRAEYGLLKPLMIKLANEKDVDLRIVVTGMHLSPEFGMTVKEIEEDGIKIDKKIEILMSSDTSIAMSKSMGLALISFAEYFDESRPNALIVLGDRFETLAVCCAATNARVPIIHIHGGETTAGCIDEAIRHSITKMSYLHFTSTEVYRRRVIQMGENPDRVFNVGALGVENVSNVDVMTLKELEQSIGFKLGDRYAVGTFHPVTLEDCTAEEQIKEILDAIRKHQEILFLFTKANADANGRVINECLKNFANKFDNLKVLDSLGTKRYLSAIKHARFVIGNSSSGLIEAPSLKIPTIDIGDRQNGRIAGESVIHCEPISELIDKAIECAENKEYRNRVKKAVNPYGDGNTSKKIMNIIREQIINSNIVLKKQFYDIEFDVGENRT